MKKAALVLFLTLAVVVSAFAANTPGNKVDDTTMDLQAWYGNNPRMISVNPANGQVSLAYTWSSDPVTAEYTMPYVRYKDITGDKTTDVKTNYGNASIGVMPDGRHMVFANSFHIPWISYGGWGTGAVLFEESGVGTAQFDSLYWFDENPIAGPNNVLNTGMDVTDDGAIHLILYDGWGDAILYKGSQDGGFTFSQVAIFGYEREGFPSVDLHPFGDDGDVFGGAVAGFTGGKVGAVVSDQAADVYFMESLDYGQTWPDSASVVEILGVAPMPETGDPNNLRAGMFNDIAYDAAGNAHVVFDASYYLDFAQAKARTPYPGYGSVKPYLVDYPSIIGHWSPATGMSTVVTAAPAMDLDDLYYLMPGRGRPALACFPTIAVDDANGVYVGYTLFSEKWGTWTTPENDPVQNGKIHFVGKGELCVVASKDGGSSWGKAINITNTPDFDERNLVLNKQVVDGKLHMVYFGDEGAGWEFINYLSNPYLSGVYYYAMETSSAVASATPGTKVDDTTMDLQAWYGNNPRMISVNPANGQVSLAYTWSSDPVTAEYTMPYVRYKDITGDKTTDVKTNYGNASIGVMPDGRHMVFANSFHIPWISYGGWGTGAVLFEESGVGTAQFDSLYWFDENPIAGPNNVLNTGMDVTDDGAIHLILYDGWGDAILYKGSQDGGFTFSQVAIFGYEREGFPSVDLHPFGDDGDVFGGAVAGFTGGKVGAVVSDQAADVYFMESLDYGQTWPDSASVVEILGVAPMPETGDPNNLRAGMFNDIAYDAAGHAHVVFDASYYLDFAQAKARTPYPGYGSVKPYLVDYPSIIGHWSPATGMSTVVTAAPAMDLDDLYYLMPGRGRPALACFPTIAVDDANGVYVGYTLFSEKWGTWTTPENDPVQNGKIHFVGKGELCVVGSQDGGATWGDPLNFTDSPTYDERNLVLNKQVVDGKLHMVYFGDEGAGWEFINYLSNPFLSHVYYHTVSTSEVPVYVAAETPGTLVDNTTMDLQSWYGNNPRMISVNPANGQVSLAYTWSSDPVTAEYTMPYVRYKDITGDKTTDVKTNYGNASIGVMPDGRHMVFANSFHIPWISYGGWGTGAVLFEESGVGTAQFDSLYWFDENPIAGPNNVLNTGMDVTDDGAIHLILYDGWGDAILYKGSQDGGFTFSQVAIFGYERDGFPSVDLHPFGDDGDVYGGAVAGFTGGKVGAVVSDQAADVYFMESLDYGQTWPDSASVVEILGVAPMPETGDPNNLRAGMFNDIAYDAAGHAHVVFDASYYLDFAQAKARTPYPGYGSVKPYLVDYPSIIGHWSPATGMSTVVTAAPGKDLDDLYYLMPGRGRPALACYPTVAVDDANGVYVGYTLFSEKWGTWTTPENDPVQNGKIHFVGKGELCVVGSKDGGAKWGEPVNITETPTFDERNLVLNKQVVDGKLHMVYFGDEGAGWEYINYLSNPYLSGVYYLALPVSSIPTGVKDRPVEVVESYELAQNYPNPFNPTTTIDFSVPKTSQIKLTVYNMLGQKVKTLVDQSMAAGKHSIKWNGTDESGNLVTSGMYIYRIEGQFGVKSQKLMFLK